MLFSFTLLVKIFFFGMVLAYTERLPHIMGKPICHQPLARGGRLHKKYGNRRVNTDFGMLGCTINTAKDSG